MSGHWFDPKLPGGGVGQSTSLGATVSTTAWPGGSTLGATTSTTIYKTGLTLGTAPNSTPWPPDDLGAGPPTTIFEDGFENQTHTAWNGGAGGRHYSCNCDEDCNTTVTDALDSYVSVGAGYARRTAMRPECLTTLAHCNNGCELLKQTTNSYGMGTNEFMAHRFRIVSPYTNQATDPNFCVISQPHYAQLKYNAFGLSLADSPGDITIDCNLGYSAAGPTNYGHADSYTVQGEGAVPVDPDEWHDYIWDVTYALIYGTRTAGQTTVGGQTVVGNHPTQGRLRVYHRKPDTSLTWDLLWDSNTVHPGGVPTLQWGRNLGGTHEVNMDGTNATASSVTGAIGAQRNYWDKIGIYRGSFQNYGTNNNTLTVDHRKWAKTADFVNAEAYLNWPL